MKVPTIRTPSTQGPHKTSRPGRTDGPRFADHLDKAAESDGEVAPARVSGVSAAVSILSAQEIGEEGDRAARRQMAQRGVDILDRLEEIRRDILTGAVPRHRLENLAQSLRQRRAHVNDPRLIEIMDEIELRAAVEIAKLTR